VENKNQEKYQLIVDRHEHVWPKELISGSEIKVLAGSPADWIVNEIVDGPGQDPEIADNQEVSLDVHTVPKGTKRFTTRKPKTSPGA